MTSKPKKGAPRRKAKRHTAQRTPKRKAVTKPYEPTEAEVAAVTEYVERRKGRPHAPAVKVKAVKGKVVDVAPDHPDTAVWGALIARAFGTAERCFADMMLNQVLNLAAPGSELDKGIADGILAALHGIEPRDELEGMLATQMVATHIATMECLRRAGLTEQNFEARTMNLQQANKLARTYAAQLEALNRNRGKGQQKMTVEHVHVNAGGQAIVGTVNRGGGGNKEKQG